LFSTQLGWGFDIQKYETNIGNTYSSPQVKFLDPHGESILIRSGYKSIPYTKNGQIGPDIPLTLIEYGGLAIRYPLDFLILYARHFFNGLDIIYNTVYVPNIYAIAFIPRILNYTIWFMAIIFGASKVSSLRLRSLVSQLILPTIIALPAFLSIPVAMEVRFMLPLHFMAYILISFEVLPGFFALNPIRKKEMIFKNIFWYGGYLFLCFLLSANTYMKLQYGM